MEFEATQSIGQFENSIALVRIQNAVALNRPCIIVSPPGFGQNQIIANVAYKLQRQFHRISFNDKQLTDPGVLRHLMSEIQDQDQHEKSVLCIEHLFDTASIEALQKAQKSYADVIRLNRINTVLPILCTPFASSLFETPKSGDQQGVPSEWLIIQTHELYITMPIGTTELLHSAPPHLHQSLLGITRLAECWPEMGALLIAKLKGLGAQQEFYQKNQQKHELVLQQNTAKLQIPSQALKTTCSELLNNYQSLMNTLADKLLSHEEQMLIAHLSLFPPNIHPFLPMIELDIPNLVQTIHSLCLKNILTYRVEEGPQGTQQLLSFSNLAWRFFAQGHLRRSCSAVSLNKYTLEMIEAIQHQGEHNFKEYCRTLAIEFSLSARFYEKAMDLIVQQAQCQDHLTMSKLARIEQAISWLKFIPQRLVNLNPQARVIQSYYRLIAENNTSSRDPSLSNGKPQHLQHINYSKKTLAPTQSQKNIKPRLPSTVSIPHASIDIKETHKSHFIVSLQQMKLPKNGIRITQASLLLDIQQHIETQNILQIKTCADMMIDQSLNQQKPELFLHGLIFLWHKCLLSGGLPAFRQIIQVLLEDKRISTHMSEFRYWLHQIFSYTTASPIDNDIQGATHYHTKNINKNNEKPVEHQHIIHQIDLPAMSHLSSLGQNLLGFMTSYINGIIGLSHCQQHLVNERAQEATYHAMNLPDSMSQTIMPLWLMETFNFLQHNKLQQALTFIKNTTRNNKLGTQKNHNSLLNTFEFLANQLSKDELQEYLREQLPLKDLSHAHSLSKQIEAIALIWQHHYKKSARLTITLLEKVIEDNSFDLMPWLWLGPTSWYLLTNSGQDLHMNSNLKTNIETQLKALEIAYSKQYTFDKAYLTLSRRETEILGLVVNGCSNEVISNLLCRSLGTIKLHVHSIYKKLGVSNRVNAIKKCQISGFFCFGL